RRGQTGKTDRAKSAPRRRPAGTSGREKQGRKNPAPHLVKTYRQKPTKNTPKKRAENAPARPAGGGAGPGSRPAPPGAGQYGASAACRTARVAPRRRPG